MQKIHKIKKIVPHGSPLWRALLPVRAGTRPLRRALRKRAKPSLAPSTLDQIGKRNKIAQSSRKHDYLRRYEQELVVPAGGLIVLLAQRRPVETANTFAEFYPDARVLLLSLEKLSEDARARLRPDVEAEVVDSINAVDEVLVTRPRPAVIIESGSNRRSEKTEAFRRLFLHLAPGGVYAAEDLHAEFDQKLATGGGESVWALLTRLVTLQHWTDEEKLNARPSAERELSAAIDGLVVHGRIAFVTRRGSHLVKVHEKDVDRVLAARVGRDRFRRIEVVPAQPQPILGSFRSNDDDHSSRLFRRELRGEVRELVARVHEDVVCAPRGVAFVGDVMLPESFNQPWRVNLFSEGTIDAAKGFARLAEKPSRQLEGTYFHLDNEHSGHYGHFTTQDLAKLWAWDAAKAAYPDLRVIASNMHGKSELLSFQYEALTAFGIGREDIEVITGPVRVERLVTATQAFQNPKFLSPRAFEPWSRVREYLADRTVPVPERIFIGRGSGYTRRCKNEAAVEQLFAEHGYEILYPEKLTLAEQVRIFDGAKVTAGFGSSAMLNLVYASSPATRILISSQSYTALNEYLLGAVRGDDMHYFWCPADIPQPANGFSRQAFFSDFEFDFDRDGEALRELLRKV